MILVIGQAPSRGRDDFEPLSGASGRRLAALCGLPLDEWLATFERRNVLDAFPGRAGEGDAFPLSQAREAAAAMRATISGRRVILLGHGVCAAFRVTAPAFLWHPHQEAHLAWCPHPSGRSRWWNDPGNVKRARAFWLAATGLSRTST